MLTTLLLGMLAFSLGLLGFSSMHFGQRTADEYAATVVEQTVRRTEARIHELLRSATEMNAYAQSLCPPEEIAADRFESIFSTLAPLFALRTDLSYVGLGIEATGEYAMLERLPDGAVRWREYLQTAPGHRVIRDYTPAPGGRVLRQELPHDGYDPRERPFYRQARAAGQSVWTDSYPFWQGNERGEVPGVTFATPVVARDGRLAGVWDTDFDTFALSAYLQRLRQEGPGYAFVLEERQDRAARIIAHPSPELLLDPGTKKLLADPAAIADEAARLLSSRLPDLPSEGIHTVDFFTGGREYLGGSVRLSGENSPPWRIAMVLDRDAIMASVKANRRWAVMIFFAGSVIAVGAALWLSELAAQPLRRLQRETEAIGRLELGHTPSSPSRILEIDQLSSAMDRMKANLRSFRKYVPADLVSELVRSGEEARLGGQTARVTIYFSDIADFTASAERLPPSVLVAHLGEYLEAMSQGILQHRGTVDKYIGDAVMAFWNAPQLNPVHALDACLAALENKTMLAALQQRWQRDGKPLFHTRVGIHTGEAVVGNIGSEQRMNYTIIGDSVNLASRLEKLNAEFGTHIMISEATWKEVEGRMVARPLDEVSVRGKSEGVVCYELMALRAEASAETLDLANGMAHAFAARRERRTELALQRYEALAARFPADQATRRMIERSHRRHLPSDCPAGPDSGSGPAPPAPPVRA